MACEPAQVASNCVGTDIKPKVVFGQTQGHKIARIQHGRVDGMPRRAGHVVGADPLKELLRICSGNLDLAEARLIEARGVQMRDAQRRRPCGAEVESPFPTEPLAEMRAGHGVAPM